jgi:hypothetical protein
MLDKSVEIPEQQFVANADAYKVTDSQIDGWAEQSVGAYLTQQIDDSGKSEKTATEAQIDAKREFEAADVMIRRWVDQFSNLTQIQQTRAFSDERIAEARRLTLGIMADPTQNTKELFDQQGLDESPVLQVLVEIMLDPLQVTDDEIRRWRDSPASPFAHASDAAISQGVTAVVQKYMGNPNIDQGKMIARDVENMVGSETAQEFVIPQADQTVVAEAKRQQMIESTTMMSSQLPMPVSPRDNHLIHGQTIQELLTTIAAPVLSSPNPPPELMKATELNLNHLLEHLKVGRLW